MTHNSPRILMVAAENDALPGAKVGGVADVIRDLPVALNKHGCITQTVTPSYGKLARLPKLDELGHCHVRFRNKSEKVVVFKRRANQDTKNKHQADAFILHSGVFTPQGENVYCHDGDDRPFATDATKFAFFCAAVAKALTSNLIPKPDILHCHDWHAALLLVLIKFSEDFDSLRGIKTVFSIHNLAMQGVRPFKGDESAFESWFPGLKVDAKDIADPNAKHCINPMRAGILLADKIHTVSPTYAREILNPSQPELGIYGGEGLERDLKNRDVAGNLIGILNGCEYPKSSQKKKPLSKTHIVKLLEKAVLESAGKNRELLAAHWIAEKRIKHWAAKKTPSMVLTSVGRITDQKARLFTTELPEGGTALSSILTTLGTKGVFIMVGSGDQTIEQSLVAESAQHDNFIFINGYAPDAAEALYSSGDLFMMPSSFEPCGISQLLAMRAGQPCLVNRVGGLHDTVEHDKTGFAFEGDDVESQALAMVSVFEQALKLFTTNQNDWSKICSAASKVRFTWDKSAAQYLSDLYAIE